MASSSMILGTVQLGMNYGVANVNGQPDYATARDIVQTAWQNGVREFDTAIGYGESETILGRILEELDISTKALINSKPDHHWDGSDFDVLDKDLDASLARLGVDHLHTLLLHREHLLEQWDKGLAKGLQRITRDGRVKRIGISVYTPKAALRALSLEGLDVVQIPTNFLDRRFEKAGVAAKAADMGKEIQIRSIFLQGLIFLTPDTLPENMVFAAHEVNEVEAMTQALGIDRLEAAMGYIHGAWPDSAIIFGAETVQQVQDNLNAFRKDIPKTLVEEAQRRFPDVSEKVLNPSLWGA